MPNQVFDLNPVDRITTGAIGEKGQRVFYLQARQKDWLVTVICEKEHVAALAAAIDHLLLTMAGGDADAVVEPDPMLEAGMDLEYPIEPVFRAGGVNLGLDRESQLLVIIAYELMAEDDESTPSEVRFWGTPAQMRAFSVHGQEVVAAGRPVCTMCGEPINPEGHFCPRRNGDRK